MTKVSILVPVYKAEKYIEHCAESLFSQDYDNIEFIFVNDCTPDRSIEVLQHFINEKYPEKKPQVMIINHDKNRGSAAARNTALDNATGDFVCWVDADDWLDKGAISTLVMKQAEKDHDIVIGQSKAVTDSGEQVLGIPFLSKKEDILKQMFGISYVYMLWGKLIRRDIYEKNKLRFREGINYGEDYGIMSPTVYFADKVVVIDKNVYFYNQININAQSSEYSSNKSEDKWRQYIDNRMFVVDFFQDKNEELKKCLGEEILKFLKWNLYLGARGKRKIFFNDVKNHITDFKQVYYTIGFDNYLKRLFFTNYFLYSSFLSIRSFVWNKIVEPIIKH